MRVAILDDLFDTLRTLRGFDRLAGHAEIFQQINA
jgi:hypothetical protein